jgi:hypothetical protein
MKTIIKPSLGECPVCGDTREVWDIETKQDVKCTLCAPEDEE